MTDRIGRLHLVTPDGPDGAVLAALDGALAAGALTVQVRRKASTDRELATFAVEVVARCAAWGAACLVDDRCDVALVAGAHGVHLGLDDLDVAAGRRLLGPDAVIGATCRTPDDARRAQDGGADYLGVGPVYRSGTKRGLPEPIGLVGLEVVAAAVELPVIAISGITAARVPAVLAAGAHGVAVVGAVFDAPDPAAATAALLGALGDPVAAP